MRNQTRYEVFFVMEIILLVLFSEGESPSPRKDAATRSFGLKDRPMYVVTLKDIKGLLRAKSNHQDPHNIYQDKELSNIQG